MTSVGEKEKRMRKGTEKIERRERKDEERERTRKEKGRKGGLASTGL